MKLERINKNITYCIQIKIILAVTMMSFDIKISMQSVKHS